MKKGLHLFVAMAFAGLFASPEVIAQQIPPALSEAMFKNPSDNQYKPLTWWHWINGNITKEGIRKDLTDMKNTGIGGVQLFDTHMYLPVGPIRYGTDAWYDHVKYAIKVCDSLGLEFYMMNSPGWSGSGGPWVTVEKSMKKLVYSEREVKGGSLEIRVSQPHSYEGFYKDVTILAVPSPGTRKVSRAEAPGSKDAGAAIDQNYASGFSMLPSSRDSAILFFCDEATTLNNINIDLLSKGKVRFAGTVYGSKDGEKFEPLTRFIFDEHEAETGNFSIAIPETTVKSIRLSLSDTKVKSAVPLEFTEVSFQHLYQLEDWSKRTAMVKVPFQPKELRDTTKSKAFQQQDIIDLSAYFNPATGKLNWNAPAGNWTILRFGYTSTGAHVHPAVPEGSGFEVDKLDTAAVRFQFQQTVGKMIQVAGDLTGKTFKGFLFDSFEGGYQNWGAAMPAFFEKYKGYQLKNYLPVLAGRTVGSQRESAGFLYDFEEVLTRSFASEYYGTMQKLGHRHGLLVFAEGQGGPMGPAFVNEYTDVPMNEFWTGEGKVAARENVIKQTSSIANIMGRQLVGAESFTSTPQTGKWQNTPYLMKRTGDYAFTTGINKFIFHTYTHQPFELVPGFTMGRYGAHFGRTNTWWPYASAWMKYLGRSQYLLQQGRHFADVCYLFPNDALYEFPSNTPAIPTGYNYDIIYTDYLKKARVENGDIVLPSGACYRALVMPVYGFMALETLQQLDRLVSEGITVIGNAPVSSPELKFDAPARQQFDELVRKIWGTRSSGMAAKSGYPKVIAIKDLKTAFATLKYEPDVKFESAGTDTLRYLHRQTRQADIYFISNQGRQSTHVNIHFRVAGKVPEIWDAVTGEVYPAPVFDTANGKTIVPVDLAGSGSVFVVFRKPLTAFAWVKKIEGNTSGIITTQDGMYTRSAETVKLIYANGNGKPVRSSLPAVKKITGTWKVNFLDGRGAPESISFQTLIPWNEHPDKTIRFYSGRAAYTNVVMLSAAEIKQGRKCMLELDELSDIAEIKVNGKKAGIIWTNPFRIDITSFVQQGKNEIQITVANRWINRLIGDEEVAVDLKYQNDGAVFTTGRLLAWPDWMYDRAKKREDGRYTFTTWKHYSKGDPLVKSGLTGDVKLVFYGKVL